MPTRARRVWPVMLCTSVRTSTCAGHPAQSWRGSAWERTMSRLPAGRTETSRWMPPKFHHMPLPLPVEAGRAPVGQVGARAPGGHPDGELVGTAPETGQRGLERHVVPGVAGDLAAVQVDGGVVAGALEAHHPACAARLAGQREVALVPADPASGWCASRARSSRAARTRSASGRPRRAGSATSPQRQPPGLALADRRAPARGRGVRGGRGHGARPRPAHRAPRPRGWW